MSNLDNAKILFLEGLDHFNRQEFHAARNFFLQSLEILPDRLSVLINLSATYLKLREYQNAEEVCWKIIALADQTMEAWLNLGLVSIGKCNYSESLVFFEKALNISAENAKALTNKGVALMELGQLSDAITLHDKAISANQEFSEAWLNRGLALHRAGNYAEALLSYDRAILINPRSYEAWTNRGATLNDGMGRYQDALDSYAHALMLKPDYFDALWNEAHTRLIGGDFVLGLQYYEYRWKKIDPLKYRHSHIPVGLGIESIKNKKVLIWAEQGYGDTLQFCRYVKLLIEAGAIIKFEVPDPLAPLIQSIEGCTVFSEGENFGEVDFQIPLLSLPLYFQTKLESIPNRVPYLNANEEKVCEWLEKLDLDQSKLNIGIACSGNLLFDKKHGNTRPIPLSEFGCLVDVAKLFLIQKEVRPDDRAYLNEHPEIKYLGGQIRDFSDTAAIIKNLDMVICIDTSLAHLAGALDKKVYVLLPAVADWRWFTGRTDSPWYPSARLFRQHKQGDWHAVMREVELSLAEQ